MTAGVPPSTLSLRLAATTRRTVAAPLFFDPLPGSLSRSRPRLCLSPARVSTATRFAPFPRAAAPMLSRANKTFEARNAATGAAGASTMKLSPKAAVLEKTILPLSSPRDANIADMLKKPLSSTSQPMSTSRRHPSTASSTATTSTPFCRPTTTVSKKPLQSRSPNTTLAASSASVVTLCGNAGSFDGEPEVPSDVLPVQLTAAKSFKIAQASDLAALGLSENDFDEDFIDLDFESPGQLPQSESTSITADASVPANVSFASAMTWSSSSPSHFGPPPGAVRHASSEKRDIHHLDDGNHTQNNGAAIESQLPAAKKRTMPKHWSKPEAEQSVLATPAAKPANAALWDTSASAVKAQKKQLKDQFRRPSQQLGGQGSGPGKFMADEETQAMMKDLVAQQKVTKPATVALSSEQEHVKNLVCVKGDSVFFTGPAGTGKSVLMRSIIEDLRKKYAKDPEKLGVTASTGLAACNIGGMTLHSFSGIGLGKEDVPTLVRKIRRNPKAKTRWLKTKTLIIDEISMVDGDLFDKLSNIGRSLRNNGRPWGGIQLVLTGDFFQLPPVPDRESRDVKFAFDATTWATSIKHTIGLTQVFRQRDPDFAQMLNEMREGRISDKTVQTFKALSRKLQFDDGIEVTELFPTRHEVDTANQRRLQALKGKAKRYEALDVGNEELKDRLLQNMMAPKSIELREGAQVMLIKNLDENLVNGSLGRVVKFMTERDYGMSEDGEMEALIDPDAKSRASILNSYMHKGAEAGGDGGGRLFPLVEFHCMDGTKRTLLMRPEEWKVELPNGQVQASRSQLPLILAWALSIHKAQGQTLERVKVNLGRVFEKGQAYVALSRATTKEGLEVIGFEKNKVMAHPRVNDFYSKLYSAEKALRTKGGNASILAFARRS